MEIETQSHANNIKLAVFFGLLGSFCYATMSLFVKLIGTGQSTATVTFVRFFLGFVILLPWLLTEKSLFPPKYVGKLLLRSLTTLLTIGSVFYSLKYLPVTGTMVLNNTFPLFVPILVLILLKVKTNVKQWISVALGFAGVIWILQPRAQGVNWTALIALGSGLFAALSFLQIRLLAKIASPKYILFYMFLFCTLATAALVPFSFIKPTLRDLWRLSVMGFFGAGHQLFLTLALKHGPARLVSPLFYSTILFGIFFDWIVWNHSLTVTAIPGILLVIAGGIATIIFKPEEKH